MTHSGAALRRFFAFVEQNGGGTFLRASLLAALGEGPGGAETLGALARARIVAKGPLAEALPCPALRDCSLEVREIDSKLRLYAGACAGDPRQCDTLDLRADDVRQAFLSTRDLVAAVRALIGIDAGRGRAPASAHEPVPIGALFSDGRDVMLYLRARRDALDLLLERCRGAARPTLVLLPTAALLDVEVRSTHGPGAHVEVDALADLLAVKEGALALAPRIRPVRAPGRLEAKPLAEVPRSTGEDESMRSGDCPPLTLVVDALRGKQVMGVLANGERIMLQDGRFALLVRVVAAHVRNRESGWIGYREAGLTRGRGPISKTCGDFAHVVPKSFRVIVTDRRGSCRLNPSVVVERVDWAKVAAHPLESVKKLAEAMLKLG